MAWSSGTYTRILATSVDILLAAAVWRQYDITISSHCGLALRNPSGNRLLRGLGRLLNTIQRNHCELAIQGDMERAKEAITALWGP